LLRIPATASGVATMFCLPRYIRNGVFKVAYFGNGLKI
jgi:hypothetical protein